MEASIGRFGADPRIDSARRDPPKKEKGGVLTAPRHRLKCSTRPRVGFLLLPSFCPSWRRTPLLRPFAVFRHPRGSAWQLPQGSRLACQSVGKLNPTG